MAEMETADFAIIYLTNLMIALLLDLNQKLLIAQGLLRRSEPLQGVMALLFERHALLILFDELVVVAIVVVLVEGRRADALAWDGVDVDQQGDRVTEA
ncbi:hypothetical protein IQ06DRAFT_98709 [Phaeosphaeriaceae sp. SRC1lsM3a]|nr:hypothetical protein IQ06DRAFT_98709 [Stagonospora sp. SRC1lsM3a]